MRKFLITTFFVAVMATPAAAQEMAPATTAAPKPVAMRAVVPAMVAPRPAPVMSRTVTPKPASMVAVPKAAPKAPVAKKAASMEATPVMAVEAPVMAPAASKVAPASPKKDSKGSVVGGWVLQLLLGILGIALPIILTPVVIWILKKMKVEDVKAQMMVDEMVDKAIGVGIHYANEQAHKLKDNPVDGAAKLNMAGEKALAYLKDSKVVDKGAEYIKDLIEAKLGETRTQPAVEKPSEKKEDEVISKDDK
jgi:hypothetical protein